MNQVITELKRLAGDPESRDAAIQKLQALSQGKDEQATDARIVLQDLGCPASVQKPKTKADKETDPAADINHPDHFWWLMDRALADDRAFYARAKADGLTHAEAAAKKKVVQGYIDASYRYDLCRSWIDNFQKDGEYTMRAYALPRLRKELVEVRANHPEDWPTIALIEETLAAYPDSVPDPQPKQ